MIPENIESTIDWLIKTENFSTAKELVFAAAKYLPADDPRTTDFIASKLHKSKYYPEALQFALKTVEIIPDSLEGLYNVARCLNSCGEPAKAEKAIRRVVNEQPDWADPKIDLAMYVCWQGRFQESVDLLLDAQSRLPADDKNHDVIRFNLGWHTISDGDFKKGMQYLSIGRKMRIWGAAVRQYPKPKLLKGMDVNGRTIAIVGEGGAGDEIINVRFAKTLKQRGAKVIFVTNQGLRTVFQRISAIEKVYDYKDLENLQYDFWTPAMDLPMTLDLDVPELLPEPYLIADPEYLNKWKQKIPPSKKLKVGLRWQGNPLYEQNLYRSVPFADYLPLFEQANVEFYSLQKDSGLEEIPVGTKIVDLADEMKTWEDTVAAISCLDLVITSCTSIAHLAGALGKKVWVLAPINSYYVWALPPLKSPWYSDVTQYRQVQFRNWDKVFVDLKKDFAKLVQERSACD